MFQKLYSAYLAAYSVGDIPKYFLNAMEKSAESNLPTNNG